jgi:hypothetical protein
MTIIATMIFQQAMISLCLFNNLVKLCHVLSKSLFPNFVLVILVFFKIFLYDD